jgi:hypothetical protein
MELSVKVSHLISNRTLAGIAIAALGLCISLPAHAQEAVAAFNGYNSAFLVQNGTTAFYSTAIGSTSTQCEWTEGLDMSAALDAYRHTHSAADRTLVTNLINTLNVNNASGGTCGGPWEGDGWDDNLAWMVEPFLRAYMLIGNTAWLTQAEDGFNTAYNDGWDTTVAGGGIWEERPQDISKCALSNDPFIWEGVDLYIATGDSSYLTKAEQIYEWARNNLANMTSSSNGRGAPGQVNGCVGSNGQLQSLSTNVYDSGSFLEAAATLYGVTGSSEYYNDAQLDIKFVQSEGTIIPYQNSGEHKHSWEYWFTRGLSDFATDASLWGTYQTYLQNNANAAWNERNGTYNITWNDWSNPTNLNPPDGAAEPNMMLSAEAVWQHLPPPAVSLSGTWEIQNVNSTLALEVSGASKANKAAIVQEPFASGNNAYLWTFKATSGGYYQIINVNSGEAVNVSGSSGLSEALIDQWPPAASMNPGSDEWLPVVNPDGSYSFYNHNSYQALDVPGSSKTAGQQLDQYFGNGGNNQEFTLIAE